MSSKIGKFAEKYSLGDKLIVFGYAKRLAGAIFARFGEICTFKAVSRSQWDRADWIRNGFICVSH
jgi:hypothetical protein